MRLVTNPWGQNSILLARGYQENERWQWQPTVTTHDPNPPITIENPMPTISAIAPPIGAQVI